MSRLVLLVIVTVAIDPVRAQESAVPVADSLRASGNFPSAIEAYRDALVSTGADVAYAIASTYALQGQFPDSAFHYLDVAMASEMSAKPLYDPDLFFLTRDSRWSTVEDRVLNHLAGSVGENFDRTYAKELLNARMREWAYRWHIMYGFRTMGPESPVLTALADAMQANHARNEQVIFKLLDEKGWPYKSQVGEEAAYAAGNLVNHADLETRQRYLPTLESACRAGEADWSDYAHILDRTELELGRLQVYGTQMEMNDKTGQFEPRPMIDPERVDDRRAAKGMEPLEAQLVRFNAAMKRDFGG